MNPANYSKISFPFFGIEINPPKGFTLGPLDIRFYGVIIALGLILAVVYGLKRKEQFGLTEDSLLNGVLMIVPIAIIFARAYYCIFSWEEFAHDPISVLYIWNGGIAIYGGVIGAVFGVWLYCKLAKLKLGAVLDITVLGFLIGQSIGRWGNFFNREAVGLLEEGSQWFLRMGLYNNLTGAYEYFHPTFLYESLWNAVGFVALHFLSKKRQYDGQVTLMYLFWYGLGRAMIEGLRMDSLYIGPFRVSQLLAVLTCLTAAIILAINYAKTLTKPQEEA
ncbi:MAG: prolipoprotein diacylglyceryl transferase [Oscillospiraceae bacterium]|nr:prolipoprotein diacylglyceryl transferase [Oscillospiraceae bacterium]